MSLFRFFLLLAVAAATVVLSGCFQRVSKPYSVVQTACIQGNCANGQGTYTHANGDKYVGEFKDGKYNGQGTYTFGSGSKYAGDKYVGEYKDNKKNGQGTYTHANGNKYVGEFKDGKRNGQGTYTFGSGSKYAGDKYVGEFKDDKYNGQGTYTFANGNKYVGEYKDGKYNGQGTFTFASGEKYVGEYKDDKRNGQGTNTFANGTKYVGEFKDDKYNGQGTKFHSDGRIESGLWERNIFVKAISLKDIQYAQKDTDTEPNQIISKDTSPKKEEYKEKTIPLISKNINFGPYHALIIGNNNYRSLPNLITAKSDAEKIANILKNNYNFKVQLIMDAKRADILLALNKLRRTLSKKDNLLIYYAGHGWLDEEAGEGYWLPVDAEQDNEINWVSNNYITKTLKATPAKHILIIADSCYSGTLARGVHIKRKTTDYYARISKKRARSVLSSGGLEPVIDSGGYEGHSVFASAFIDALIENDGILDGTQLFSIIRRPVMLNSDQTPEYSDIRKAGHAGGDFLFVRQKR